MLRHVLQGHTIKVTLAHVGLQPIDSCSVPRLQSAVLTGWRPYRNTHPRAVCLSRGGPPSLVFCRESRCD